MVRREGGGGVKKSHFCGDVIFERPQSEIIFFRPNSSFLHFSIFTDPPYFSHSTSIFSIFTDPPYFSHSTSIFFHFHTPVLFFAFNFLQNVWKSVRSMQPSSLTSSLSTASLVSTSLTSWPHLWNIWTTSEALRRPSPSTSRSRNKYSTSSSVTPPWCDEKL